MEVVSGPLAALLEALAHRGDPLVPGVGVNGAVLRAAAHGRDPATAATDGSAHHPGAPGATTVPADGRLTADLVELGHDDAAGPGLYGPPAARVRALPEPGVAAERLHQLLLLMGDEGDPATAARPAAATGTAAAASAAAMVPAPVLDPTTLALAAALVAPTAPAAEPAVDDGPAIRRRSGADDDPDEHDEGSDDSADDGDGGGPTADDPGEDGHPARS